MAQTFTTNNDTTVDGSDGNTYAYIGPPYQTLSMSVTQTGTSATINYITAFSGNDSVGGYSIGYADIFFGGSATQSLCGASSCAIALGYQTNNPNNGGVAAGVYAVSSAASSNDIWSGRSGVIYGAGYNGGQTAYTVVTGGTALEGITESSTAIAGGFYDLSITVANLPMNVVDDFENGTLTAFWGTGDCANGAFFAIPEPASFGMLMVSVLGLSYMVSRRRTPHYPNIAHPTEA